MLLSLALLHLVRPWPNEHPPSCRQPPLWPVRPRHLYGRGDLTLVGEVLHIPEGEEYMGEFPGLVAEVFRMSGIELSNGREELGGVHGPTQPLPRTASRANFSDMPSWTRLRISRPCSSERPSTEVTEELKLFSPFSREGVFSERL